MDKGTAETEEDAALGKEELRETKTPFLKVLTGGKGPPTGGKDDWLLKLTHGARFLARPKNYFGCVLGQYVVGYAGKAYFIGEIGEKETTFRWVDPVRFSTDNEFFTIIEAEHV